MKARSNQHLAVANAASNEVSSETQRALICETRQPASPGGNTMQLTQPELKKDQLLLGVRPASGQQGAGLTRRLIGGIEPDLPGRDRQQSSTRRLGRTKAVRRSRPNGYPSTCRPPGFFTAEGNMGTQMHSLREQPKTLRDLKKFHAANDASRWTLAEMLGAALLAFCVAFTVLSLAIPGGPK